MVKKNILYPEFGEQIANWVCETSPQHMNTCLHEGTHMVYARECGFEPELYGPIPGLQLGGVSDLPDRIGLTADVVSIGKFFLGPAYLLERVFGEDGDKSVGWEEIWDHCRSDTKSYHDWRRNYWRRIDRDCSPKAIRKAVYADFERAEFRERLILAAREYERRVRNLDAAHPTQLI